MNSNDAEMPGAWVCPQCGFVLQKNILHAQTGNVTANTSPLNEKCPNDATLMRPYTWPEANEDLYKRAVQQMPVVNAAVAYCDQLCTYNNLAHPEVQRRRMELADAVSKLLQQ